MPLSLPLRKANFENLQSAKEAMKTDLAESVLRLSTRSGSLLRALDVFPTVFDHETRFTLGYNCLYIETTDRLKIAEMARRLGAIDDPDPDEVERCVNSYSGRISYRRVIWAESSPILPDKAYIATMEFEPEDEPELKKDALTGRPYMTT